MLEVDVRLRRPPLDLRYRFHTEAPITGVFGPSGAGKSSLLHVIAGLLRPTEGVIRLDGRTLFDRAGQVTVPVHRRGVGLVFQDHRLFSHLTVEGNLRYGSGRGRRGDAPASFNAIVEMLQIGPLLPRRIGHLSGGERQRVALGRALLSAPRLLLLDEPLASLDGGHQRSILDFVARIRDEVGTPTLYVTHELAELLQLTDQLLVVRGGRSVAHGPLSEVVRCEAAWRTLRDLGPLNVLDAKVERHDRAAGLTVLVLPGGGARPPRRLLAPLADRAPGSTARIAIRSEDVALATTVIEGISIRNQLPGRVVRLTAHPDRAVVEVDLGPTMLIEVSHATVRQMAIAPGREVNCLIKSNAVTYVG